MLFQRIDLLCTCERSQVRTTIWMISIHADIFSTNICVLHPQFATIQIAKTMEITPDCGKRTNMEYLKNYTQWSQSNNNS